MNDEGLPKIEGKFLILYAKDHCGTIVEQARFENQGGRLFIVGTERSAWPDSWQEGLHVVVCAMKRGNS